MYTLTIRPEDAKYFMEAQEKLGEAIINAFKKYWNENGEMVINGLLAMSGNYSANKTGGSYRPWKLTKEK